MRNYINTPSSFAFTTESSYSADLISARSKQSDINALQSISDHGQSFMQSNTHRQQQEELDEEDEAIYKMEDIYIGLNNIKKNKCFTAVFVLLDQRLKNFLQFAFRVLSLRVKRYGAINIRKAAKIIHLFTKKHQKTNKQKAFSQLRNFLKFHRNKQLKSFSLLKQSLFLHFYDNMREIFRIWKLQQKITENNLTKRKLALKMIKMLLLPKLHTIFFNLKHFKRFSSPIKASTQQNESGSKKLVTFSIPNMISSNNKVIPQGSYSISFQQNLKKMTKTNTKSAEYRASTKSTLSSYYKICQTINQLLTKHYRHSFSLLQHFQLQPNHTPPSVDSPQIVTNLLKHVCWLASREHNKQKNKMEVKKMLEKQKKIQFLCILATIRQKECLRDALYFWRKAVVGQRLVILDKVKQLERVKENFVESYK